MNTLIAAAMLTLNCLLANAKVSDEIEIKGAISGLPDGEIQFVDYSGKKPDTLKTKSLNGEFSFRRNRDQNAPLYGSKIIVPSRTDGKGLNLYLINGDRISIMGTYAFWPHMQVEGSETYNTFQAFQQVFRPIEKQREEYLKKIEELAKAIKYLTGEEDVYFVKQLSFNLAKAKTYFKLSNTTDSLLVRKKFEEFQDERSKLRDMYKNTYDQIDLLGLRLAKEYFDSYYSLIFVRTKLAEAKFRNNALLFEESKNAYNYLSDRIKSSTYGQDVAKEVSAPIKPAFVKGRTIWEITGATLTGEIVSLREVLRRNRYTLLDFWASWCKPCRAQVPHLKSIYQDYHNKGFEIVAVTLDDKAEDWKKASQVDALPWINLRDPNEALGTEGRFKLYRTNYVPKNYLIDNEGHIVAEDLYNGEVEQAIRQYMQKRSN